MKRRMFLIACVSLLGSVAVSPAFAKKKKNNNKNKNKNKKKSDNSAKAKEAQKKKLRAEIDRVSRKLNLVTQGHDRAVAELSSAESEVEQLKSQLDGLADDSPEKKALSRKVHAAIGRVKEVRNAIGQSEALMARGRTYLAQLEGQYAKMGGNKKR